MRKAECGIDRFGEEPGVTVRRSPGHSSFRIPNSALQERDRAAIDDHRAAGPRTQRPHDATDCAWLRGLHEDVPAPASLEPPDRARRRSAHAERAGAALGLGPEEPPGPPRG